MKEQVDLLNTPGIYYAITYWISSMVFIWLQPGRRKDASSRGVQVAVLAAVSILGVVSYHHVPMLLHMPLMAVYLYLISFNIRYSTGMGRREALYYGIRSLMLGELAAALHWQFFYYALIFGGMKLRLSTTLKFQIPIYLVVFGLTWLCERMIGRQLKPDTEEFKIARDELVIYAIMMFIVYCVSNVSYVFRNTPFTTDNAQALFIIRSVADLGGVMLGAIYHSFLCQFHARLEAEKMKQILEMQYENYRVSEESMELVNRKYHDLRHQISYLKGESSDSKRREYLEQMENEIKGFEAQNKTGNQVLDAILTSKSLRCQNMNIRLNKIVDGGAVSMISPMDLSALFGNILDNAIEGADSVEKVEERIIRLDVRKVKSFTRITAQNRYKGEVRFKDGMPVTSKKNETGYHGYGVRSIRAITEKYGGSFRVSAENGWFSIYVLIPV